MKHYKISLLLMVVLGVKSVFAQQDPQYTQYMYNTMSINPAYAGSRGMLSATALYRNQWLGLDGAPQTETLNVHSPIRESKVGVGLSIINDKLGEGVTQETFFDAAFSYTIQTSYQGNLSFGLKVGGSLLNVDFTRLNQYDDVELTGQNNIDNKFSPNIGAGIYYHTDNYYVGVSVPNMLTTKYFDESNNSNSSSYVATSRIHYYVMGGYVFDLDYRWQFKPAVLTKVVSGAPLQVDLSANFLYDESLTFGVGYRWGAAVTGMLGFQLNEALAVGLAYDREVTELGGTQFNGGTVEVFLRYEFSRNYKRVTTPRFF
ncbi:MULTISPECIES: PorP/SprF family type IX secretion system membrane protein [Galbibacter]|uniref:Type IX secretion system membrane protein PorP/SprF n=1 Tax=Galbibacter pacificus TaxID=2996052 RepID=A0ABT6FWE9_9FLAO|nr:type IX secretion system membrane protein PorP/SprF [Galbibacter pacificus]MDG3583676.1 type IX secretion system membrane protein PorP/SprF [Galbibacter pacificus]MDG3587406.1 type IX secretion system membrane protein PorP/SprF [Galbibacter pacificus]